MRGSLWRQAVRGPHPKGRVARTQYAEMNRGVPFMRSMSGDFLFSAISLCLSASALYFSSIFDLQYRCVGAQFLRVVRRGCGERAEPWCSLPFHRFPQFFRIPPLPQTLSLGQLEPHCVNPATSIRITNKLSLTAINYRATVSFDSSSPSSACLRSSASLCPP
jgi:hypothetical protein